MLKTNVLETGFILRAIIVSFCLRFVMRCSIILGNSDTCVFTRNLSQNIKIMTTFSHTS